MKILQKADLHILQIFCVGLVAPLARLGALNTAVFLNKSAEFAF
jgi:hypothetical protein